MKKIKRPDWRQVMGIKSIASESLNYWFDKHIEPVNEMLDKAVMVYDRFGEDRWTTDKSDYHDCQAYLIDIKPIKQETCIPEPPKPLEGMPVQHYMDDIYAWSKKVKAALDREKDA